MLNVRINKNIEQRLNILAKETGRTKTYYVDEALKRYLEDMEEIYIALQRLEKPENFITLDEAEKNYDLSHRS